MKKWIVFLLMVLILISIMFFALNINNLKNNEDSETDLKENQDNEITGNIVKDDSEIEGVSGDAVSGGSSGGGSSSSSNSGESSKNPENLNKERELPFDLYTKPCGHYFLEYEICGGVCPSGQCLVDGKSCYCRIVEED
jgi:hypothetical protein